MARGTDEKCLAGGNIPNNFKTQSGDGHAFTGDDVFAYTFDLSLAKDERPDTVWVPECKQSIARDNGNAGIASMNTIVDRRDGTKNGLNVDVGLALDAKGRRALAKFDGQGVEEKFGVAGGVDMPHALIAKVHSEFLGVGQIPVVCKGNAVGRVHVEGLGFGSRRRARRRIANMSNAYIALEAEHVALEKHIRNEAV